MTHIENIQHILEHGITHVSSANSNPNFIPIGDNSLISTRSNFLLKSGKRLGEYIPFYFGFRTPMLYVIHNGFNMVSRTAPENIVYCVISVQNVIDLKLDFVFTDGHAIDGFTTQYTVADIDNISSIIDWDAVKAKFWKDDNDLDLKRRKEAEFLVLGDIPSTAILGYIVSNDNAKKRINGFGVDAVYVKPNYYF